MFRNLTNFAYKRSPKEALGFYLAYLFFAILLFALAGGMADLVIASEDMGVFLRIGNFIAVILVLILSFLILRNKGLLGNFRYLLLMLLGGILAYLGGALLGLIPVAFLSTRPPALEPPPG